LRQVTDNPDVVEKRTTDLLEQMTLAEKIGQLSLINGGGGSIPPELRNSIAGGKIGGLLNEVDVTTVDELQQVALKESRLGIPLLIGRDVIHGFKTVFPIPLGLAATWNPTLVEQCGRISAIEASAAGVNWTFAPMIDISRDPRWGRIAESFGEDTHLCAELAKSMIAGFQGEDLARADSIAACAKHFAGYGASESGKDYNTTNLSEHELRNVHLVPFRAAAEAQVASFMTSFGDLNGVPASANPFLLRQILREEWRYDGFVVSDWESISQLSVHGLTSDDKESAYEAASAGVDMEMTSSTFADYLGALVEEDRISVERIDTMVGNILRVKILLGLFDDPIKTTAASDPLSPANHLEIAKRASVESIVLLKNKNELLPLKPNRLKSLALIGPLANDGYEQLGTWVFDGDPSLSQTPVAALQTQFGGEFEIHYARGMESTRSRTRDGFPEAIEAASKSDAVVMFLGEESILAGEAHCRADISLPGNQEELIEEMCRLGKPLIVVLMAGRPLALQSVVGKFDALLCAWHPGSMAGPAIVDLLFGKESPSGRLPVTFPRVAGQIPIYYSHKNTGRPGTSESVVSMDDIELNAPQHSFGDTSFHLDVPNSPLFPFGFGLSYSKFEYTNLMLSSVSIPMGSSFTVTVDLHNSGAVEAEEVVQLYVRDLVGSVTRPVKELKGFQRIKLSPGAGKTVSFELSTDDLAFYNRQMQLVTEPGEFHLWIGGCSDTDLRAEFEITD